MSLYGHPEKIKSMRTVSNSKGVYRVIYKGIRWQVAIGIAPKEKVRYFDWIPKLTALPPSEGRVVELIVVFPQVVPNGE